MKENLSGETPQRFCYVNYKTYPAATSFLLVALVAITDLFLDLGADVSKTVIMSLLLFPL